MTIQLHPLGIYVHQVLFPCHKVPGVHFLASVGCGSYAQHQAAPAWECPRSFLPLSHPPSPAINEQLKVAQKLPGSGGMLLLGRYTPTWGSSILSFEPWLLVKSRVVKHTLCSPEVLRDPATTPCPHHRDFPRSPSPQGEHHRYPAFNSFGFRPSDPDHAGKQFILEGRGWRFHGGYLGARSTCPPSGKFAGFDLEAKALGPALFPRSSVKHQRSSGLTLRPGHKFRQLEKHIAVV